MDWWNPPLKSTAWHLVDLDLSPVGGGQKPPAMSTIANLGGPTMLMHPPISYAGPCWFVVVTNPRCLLRAQLDLDAAGYRTFTPKTRKWVTHARVKKAVEKPILSRYLFVEVDYPRQSFGAVKGCNGVETILSDRGVPVPVPPRFVEDMLVRYLKGEWDEVASGPLPLGARIRVMEGAFADMLATITNVDGKKISAKIFGTNDYKILNVANIRAA